MLICVYACWEGMRRSLNSDSNQLILPDVHLQLLSSLTNCHSFACVLYTLLHVVVQCTLYALPLWTSSHEYK